MSRAGGRNNSGEHRTDTELIHAHVAGDPHAFTELVHRHRDRMWAVALRTTRDPEEAADGLQDAFLSAHRAARKFRGDSAVTTWLHRIVVNACLDLMRRRQARPTVTLPEDDQHEMSTPGDAMAEKDLSLLVHEALLSIPADQRAAVVAVDVEGYSVGAAAEALGVASGTIKSRCARGRTKLAVILGHLRAEQTAAEPSSAVGNRSTSGRVSPPTTPASKEDR